MCTCLEGAFIESKLHSNLRGRLPAEPFVDRVDVGDNLLERSGEETQTFTFHTLEVLLGIKRTTLRILKLTARLSNLLAHFLDAKH